MNIIARLKQAISPRIVTASLPGGSMEFLRRWGKPPDVSHEALVRKYWGWVYACAMIGANRVASTPLRAYASRGTGEPSVKHFRARKVDRRKAAWLKKRVGKSVEHVYGAEDYEELDEHPILELFEKVNDQENGFELRELTSIMLDLTGNAYWYVERDKLGTPSALFLLRSQWVEIIPDVKHFVGGYKYGVSRFGMEELTLTPDQVVHFKYPNPNDPWYGLGPVQASAYTLEAQEAREQFIVATMRNMGRPDLVVKYLEGELDPADRQLLEREWNQLFRGPKNAGKVKVTDFRYEVEKLGWNPQELRFNDGEDWIMKKICAAFPVPIGLIDTSQISRAPRAGMEGADLFMAQFNTLPRCTRIEEKINEKLCPMYDGRLFVAFDDPVPQDKARQMQEDQLRLASFQTTVNEIRERDGEDPVPWGDVPLAPPGIAPLGSAPSAEGGPGAPGNTPSESESPSPSAGGSPGGAFPFDKSVKQAGDGVIMEVEGAYLHPTLEGVPIRIRPATRNERGRFDRTGAGRLRAAGDAGDRAGLRGVFGRTKG